MQNQINPPWLKHEVIYRSGNPLSSVAINACGLMKKDDGNADLIDYVESRYVIVYVLAGSGTYTDESGRIFELVPGAVFQRFPNMKHSTKHTVGSDYHEAFAAFGTQFFDALLSAGVIDRTRPVFYPGLILSIMEDFVRLLELMKKNDEPNDGAALLLGHQIIFSLFDAATPRAEANSPLLDAKKILDNDQSIPLAALAEHANLSYENFRKLFRAKFHLSPGAYRNIRRIEKGCKLLKETSLSLKEIADVLHYSDVHSFTKQFSAKMGVSPRAFRKN